MALPTLDVGVELVALPADALDDDRALKVGDELRIVLPAERRDAYTYRACTGHREKNTTMIHYHDGSGTHTKLWVLSSLVYVDS